MGLILPLGCPPTPRGAAGFPPPAQHPTLCHAPRAFPALSKPHLSRLGKKNQSQLGHRDGSSASLQPPPCPQTCQRQISKPRAITHRLCSDKRETAPGSFPCNQRQLSRVTGGGDSRDRGAGDVTSPPRHVGPGGVCGLAAWPPRCSTGSAGTQWLHSWESEIRCPRDPREGKQSSKGRDLPQTDSA